MVFSTFEYDLPTNSNSLTLFSTAYPFPLCYGVGIFEAILRLTAKIFGFLKTPFVPIIVLKTTAWSQGFNAKIGLKNGPPWAKISEKKQNGVVVWFGVPSLKTFLHYILMCSIQKFQQVLFKFHILMCWKACLFNIFENTLNIKD